MHKKVHYCEIKTMEKLAENIYDVWIHAPEIAREAAPGQFLHIKCGGGALLRRPISICDANDTLVRFVFEERGQGTGWLKDQKPGDVLDVLGPLGNGFKIAGKNPVIIGGGIGIFPLLMLAKKFESPKVFLGFRNCARMVLKEDFESCGNLCICTDDGSYGERELVTELARKELENADMVYACGPAPMLRAVKKMAKDYGVPAQLSLEERMGCGVGACLVCVCSANGHFEKVCQKGPVFWSDEVEFDD